MGERIEKEKQIVEKMVRHYCRLKHKQSDLCDDCRELLAYSHRKLDLCRYGEEKSFCSKCTTHCYQKVQREMMREVMRTVGPHMLYLMPLEFIKHIFGMRS